MHCIPSGALRYRRTPAGADLRFTLFNVVLLNLLDYSESEVCTGRYPAVPKRTTRNAMHRIISEDTILDIFMDFSLKYIYRVSQKVLFMHMN